MAILIDPPLWPAHGTDFSHLVSDVSVEELHAFAATTGLSRRAFDRDHYDVPRRRFDALVAAGALPVPATELARRLIRSGVRIPAHQRPERLHGVLTDAWDRMLPGHSWIASELMVRWSEPHRHYHDRAHLLAVLRALDLLRSRGEPVGSHPRAPWLAAWFHDAVYAGVPGRDEEESARLAEVLLPPAGVPSIEVDEVARLVRLTIDHRPGEHDAGGRLLCDADLEVLARPGPAYRRYMAAVRRDYSTVSDVDFARGRGTVLRSMLETEQLFGTAIGHDLWEERARANLTAELAELPAVSTPSPELKRRRRGPSFPR